MLTKLKPKSEFSRNVLTLMTGTTIAQAIPIAISPILTRIYTPEDFGVFALYMSMVSIFAVVATGRYELAIMLPKHDKDAANIVAISLIISLLISFITLLIVFFFNDKITTLLGNSKISSWLYFVPLSVLLTGFYQSFNYWLNRRKQYKQLAKSIMMRSSSNATVNLGMGFSKLGSSGLIFGSIFGQSVATYVLGKIVWKEKINIFNNIKKNKLLAMLKKHKKLPMFNLPNALIDGFRLSGINILIAKFFTTDILGQFSLAWKMVQTPISLVSSSLSQVFFQRISSEKGNLYRIVYKFVLKAVIISLPIFLIIYFFAEDIFQVVFGENWQVAGKAASIMSPWLFLNFITSPLSSIFIVLNKQDVMLKFSIIYMLTPLIIIYVFNRLGFLIILNYLSISMALLLLFFIFLSFYYAKKDRDICIY